MPLAKDPERTETKALRKYADFAGRRVLEIGCGDGRLVWQYGAAAHFVTGIDLDADDLRVARIERPSDVPAVFVRGDSERLPFPKEVFDLAILAWSF